MNKLLIRSLTLMLVALVSLPILAAETEEELGFWVEARVASKGPSEVIGYYEKSFTNTFGVYGLAFVGSDGYREGYVGPTWKPFPWIKLGVGVGREADKATSSAIRRNVFFDSNWGKFSAFGTFENGGSGPFHKVTVTYKISNAFGAGIMDETDLGRGPRFEYNFGKSNVQLWGALLHERTTTLVIGINKSF